MNTPLLRLLSGVGFAVLWAVSAVTVFGQAAPTTGAPAVTVTPDSAAEPAKTLTVDPLDWPNWRGPRYNGVSTELNIPDTWSPKGENLIWKSKDLGSRSSPILIGGKIYTITRDNPVSKLEGEKVVCAEAATGKILWEHRVNVFLADVPDTRVGWSNLVGDPTTGRIYFQAVGGMFVCLEGDTGKVVWECSLCEEWGLLTTYGGRTNIPVVVDDLVVISGVFINWGEHARPVHSFVGFDKANGKPRWYSHTKPLPDDTTYSTPVPCVLNGQLAIVFGAADGWVYALQARTGKEMWKYWLSQRGLNATPLVVGDTVYMGSSEENIDDNTQGALVAIDGTGTGDVTKTKQIWKTKEMGVGRTSPLLVNDVLYAADDIGKLLQLDPKTGKLLGKEKLGTIMRSSPLYADGKIFVGEANGRWYIYKIEGKGLKATNKQRLDGEIHGSPFVSHGRLYIPTTEMMYCVGYEKAEVKANPAPALPQEAPVADDQVPAQLQIVPVEALLAPNEKLPYTVRVFNAKGQLLQETTEAALTLAPAPQPPAPPRPAGAAPAAPVKETPKVAPNLGSIAGTSFTAPDVKAPVGVQVTATLGKLTTTARVRVIPPLPWKFDFADKQIPLPWIGMRYRHQIREIDGKPQMVKITTIPKGTRSQGWFGPPSLHDYTVQADVKGSIVEGKMPDIGLVNQRYRFDVMGASQQLKLYSWIAHEIKFVDKPFEWKPDVWYRMKFQVENKTVEGRPVAVLKGKFWVRDEEEPTTWQIESIEELPDTHGSPGLFGNAKDAEIFYENILVYPNAPADGTK